jgi:hypothetical protein
VVLEAGLSKTLLLLASVGGLVFLTILAAFLTGGPILFPDSVGYFHAGASAVAHLGKIAAPHHASAGLPLAAENSDGISTARSVYYGLFYVAAFMTGGEWALPILQAAICTVALWLCLRRIAAFENWRGPALIVAIFAVTGLAVFCATAMPDVFAGLMLLAVAMILTYARAMAWPEYLFWLAMTLCGCLFHRGLLIVFVVTLAIAALALRRQSMRQLLALALVGWLAVVAHLAVDVAVKKMSGDWPIQTPFLLARFVGDGTVKPFLEGRCPTRHYELCRFVHRMPMSENEFLWGEGAAKSVMGPADKVRRQRIAAEAPSIEIGVIRAFPLQQSGITAENVLAQMFDVGVLAYQQKPTLSQDRPPTALHPVIARYLHRNMDRATGFLRLQSALMLAVYLLSVIGCVALLAIRSQSYFEQPERRLVAVLLVGMIANALVFGAISGVFDRYQGRLAWLPVLGLAMLLSRREVIARGTATVAA